MAWYLNETGWDRRREDMRCKFLLQRELVDGEIVRLLEAHADLGECKLENAGTIS
ncbi:uncharacterized protein RCO7_08925 [Rhynchosporium graminicola]|uniref:Uncharacterized protein n=2 Tax=Rhynchosporium TaxID=38037 RepID=A0A1E1MNP8_RHYSE|nr:uncharacterized protein RCO7_08925 [Rhynchosporium commune]CZT50709.1 uncharacterized protein RSE6_11745 [Rhynchosporium secalis]